MRKIFFIFIVAVLLSSCDKNQGKPQQINLKSFSWSLTDTADSLHLSGVNPSDVYMALLQKGVIDKPFYRDNEPKLQWVGRKDWIFSTDFNLSKEFLLHDRIEIDFKGLDTYADVYLNQHLILKANNMFRSWKTDVKSILKPGHNKLKIVFTSPIKIISKKKKQLPYPLPDSRAFVRKAAYQFGWDWGPKFVTMGIWRPAFLLAWDQLKIRDVFIRQDSISKRRAKLTAILQVKAVRNMDVKLRIFTDNKSFFEKKVNLEKGFNLLLFPLNINHPRLWWPNGLGKPNLYTFNFSFSKNGNVVDDTLIQTGLRRLCLIQKPDKNGKSFYFQINGKAVFAKGANYIPPDNFLSRVTDAKYKQIIETARKSNMNMLRVWGGGTYEKNLFYRLCDENGIMVWHDFMFAGSMYPGDSAFIQNVTQEVRQNISRLRNHPCIALWCGNNEIDEAWHNWGWQKQFGYSKTDSAKLWENYQYLFEQLLPEMVKKYDPKCSYWPSSPSIGWGHVEAYREGDVHYWGVWWGKAPFKKYDEKVGRFMSEYGFQAMPDKKTIDDFSLPRDRFIKSKVMQVHQKHPFGWQNIHDYLLRHFQPPENFDDLIYKSQLLQDMGIKRAIEAHRRAKPYCMGTLYWQLNDCWPVTSWSSIDYYGRWKALQYAVKKAYATYLVSVVEKNHRLKIFVVSDDTSNHRMRLKWRLIDFNGKLLSCDSLDFALPANKSLCVDSIYENNFAGDDLNWRNHTVLEAVVEENGKPLARGLHYFDEPKNLLLSPVKIKTQIERKKDKLILHLSCRQLVKSVYLQSPLNVQFSNNYFDLLPGEEKTVVCQPVDKADYSFKAGNLRLKIRHLIHLSEK